MEIENLRSEMAKWPVQWRWEGVSGHPRRILDNLVQTLEDHGFTVDVADVPLTQGPVGNVGEFEGALIARLRQSRTAALRRKWAAALVGVLLAPVVVGIFMIKYALEGRKYQLGLEWRGEAYPSTARADQGGFGAERSGIVSDIRVTMRGATSDADRQVNDLSDLQPTLDRVQWTLSETLPSLTMPASMTAGAPGLEGAVEGTVTATLEDAPHPSALDEGRKDA